MGRKHHVRIEHTLGDVLGKSLSTDRKVGRDRILGSVLSSSVGGHVSGVPAMVSVMANSADGN